MSEHLHKATRDWATPLIEEIAKGLRDGTIAPTKEVTSFPRRSWFRRSQYADLKWVKATADYEPSQEFWKDGGISESACFDLHVYVSEKGDIGYSYRSSTQPVMIDATSPLLVEGIYRTLLEGIIERKEGTSWFMRMTEEQLDLLFE